MITFQLESFQKIFSEIEPLFKQQWDELQNVPGLVYNPDFMLYSYLDQVGMLLLLTARKDGEIIGYLAVVLKKHPYAKDSLNAYEEVFYVIPSMRNGKVGTRMIRFMENALKMNLVHNFFIHENMKHPVGAYYKRLGYEHKFTLYVKSFVHNIAVPPAEES